LPVGPAEWKQLVTGRKDKSVLVSENTTGEGAINGARGNRRLHLPRRGLRGQELIEFALAVPILALFIFGVLDMGRIFHVLIAISNAAREGARYGMSYGIIRTVNSVYTINEPIIDAAAVKEAANLNLKLTNAQVTPTCQSNPDPASEACGSGVRLRVQVVYTFRPILSIIFPQVGFDLMREMEMVIP